METIQVMLAKKGKPFNDKNWFFEAKLDGERMVAFIENNEIIRLQNRNLNDCSFRYPEIIGTKTKMKSGALDGEIIVCDEKGIPEFNLLAKRSHLISIHKIKELSQSLPAKYIAFDLLKKDDQFIVNLPLHERKKFERDAFDDCDRIGFLPFIDEDGENYFDKLVKFGFEGVMAKKKDSLYRFGVRADTWLKIKPQRLTMVDVYGYAEGNGAREKLGALLIGEFVEFEKDNVRFVRKGRVGSGLSERAIKEFFGIVKKTKKTREGILVLPMVKIQIGYFEITEAGHYRHPVFKKIVSMLPVYDENWEPGGFVQ